MFPYTNVCHRSWCSLLITSFFFYGPPWECEKAETFLRAQCGCLPNICILRALTIASYGILITQQPKAFIQQPLLGLLTSLVWRAIKRESKELNLKIDLLTHKLHFVLLCDYKILKYLIRRGKMCRISSTLCHSSVYSVPS